MFNDRDLGILGAGALAAVLCLFLPFSFTLKVTAGFLTLVLFMIAALLRLGPDRVPLETFALRKLRFQIGIRKFVNQQQASSFRRKAAAEIETRPLHSDHSDLDLRPVDLAWDEVGVYPLLTAFLAVVAVYFSVWLARGGADELSIFFRR